MRTRKETTKVSYRHTIVAAFERVRRTKPCHICGGDVPAGRYTRHVDACKLRDDDSDCEVLMDSIVCFAGAKIEIASQMSQTLPLPDDPDEPQASTSHISDNSLQSEPALPLNEVPNETNVQNVMDEASVLNNHHVQNENTVPYEETCSMSIDDEPPPVTQPLSEPSDVQKTQQETTASQSSSLSNVTNVMPSTSTSSTDDPGPTSAKRRRSVQFDLPGNHVDKSTTKKYNLLPKRRSLPPGRRSNVRTETVVEKTVDPDKVKIEVVTAASLIQEITNLQNMAKVKTEKGNDSSSNEEGDNKPSVNEDEASERKNSPYFVNFMLVMLKRILSAEENNRKLYDENFWGPNMATFEKFIHLSPSAKNLLMRMFLRKRTWLTKERLLQRYEEMRENMDNLCQELESRGFVENSTTALKDLDVALKLLPLPNMRVIAKKFHLDITKAKLDLSKSLVEFAAKHKDVFGNVGGVARKLLIEVKKSLGPCYQINEQVCLLFKCIFTLFSPTETNSVLADDKPSGNIEQAFMYLMLRVATKQLVFSCPETPQVISIYRNLDDLTTYVEAKEMEVSIVSSLSYHQINAALQITENCKQLLIKQETKELIEYASTVPSFLRRFTAPWVLIRCIFRGTQILEKQKNYALAVEWQKYLLKSSDVSHFCMDHRGEWWERLVLNLDAHLNERMEAMEEIHLGLADPYVKDKDKLKLQDRAIRITKKELNTFNLHVVIQEATVIEISNEILSKNIGDPRVNRFICKKDNGDVEECSVEEVVRRHYLKSTEYTTGVHAEGSIWHTVLGLVFYESFFDSNHPHVYLSEYQISPADLNTEHFYKLREKQFTKQLEWFQSIGEEELSQYIEAQWTCHHGETNSEINWELFSGPDEVMGFINSLPRQVWINLFQRLLMDYRNTRSGFPDLTLWNPQQKIAAVVEVKGPNDRLSTKQRLWLHYFQLWGVRADVCYVSADSGKRI